MYTAAQLLEAIKEMAIFYNENIHNNDDLDNFCPYVPIFNIARSIYCFLTAVQWRGENANLFYACFEAYTQFKITFVPKFQDIHEQILQIEQRIAEVDIDRNIPEADLLAYLNDLVLRNHLTNRLHKDLTYKINFALNNADDCLKELFFLEKKIFAENSYTFDYRGQYAITLIACCKQAIINYVVMQGEIIQDLYIDAKIDDLLVLKNEFLCLVKQTIPGANRLKAGYIEDYNNSINALLAYLEIYLLWAEIAINEHKENFKLEEKILNIYGETCKVEHYSDLVLEDMFNMEAINSELSQYFLSAQQNDGEAARWSANGNLLDTVQIDLKVNCLSEWGKFLAPEDVAPTMKMSLETKLQQIDQMHVAELLNVYQIIMREYGNFNLLSSTEKNAKKIFIEDTDRPKWTPDINLLVFSAQVTQYKKKRMQLDDEHNKLPVNDFKFRSYNLRLLQHVEQRLNLLAPDWRYDLTKNRKLYTKEDSKTCISP